MFRNSNSKLNKEAILTELQYIQHNEYKLRCFINIFTLQKSCENWDGTMVFSMAQLEKVVV